MQPLMEKGWFKLVVAVVTVGVLFVLGWTVLGKTIGTPCQQRMDCYGLSARCLNVRTRSEFICTRVCATATDCPGGWTCDEEPLLNTHSQEVSVVQLCSPPEVVPVVP